MNHSTIATLTALLAALLLAACQQTPQIQSGPDAEILQGNLVRVDNSRVKMAYVDPRVDFSKYTAIRLMPLGLDDVQIVQPSSGYPMPGSRKWELTDADKLKLQQGFQAAMTQQLSVEGGYRLVDAPAPDVLRITPILTRLAPNAPKDDLRSRPTGRGKVFTEGAGSLDISVVFSDSESGEVLALTKDSRSGSSQWGINNSLTNAAEVRRAFTAWAILIRKQLDQVRKAHPQGARE